MATYTNLIKDINLDHVKKFILYVCSKMRFDVQPNGCLCCQSYLCGNKWSPILSMYDLGRECYAITIMKCLNDMNFGKNYLGLLPEEILTVIESFV